MDRINWGERFDNYTATEDGSEPNLFGQLADPQDLIEKHMKRTRCGMGDKVKEKDGDIDYKDINYITKDKSLKIVPFKTNKGAIKRTKNMESNTICAHPASIIFNGKSGSGKSNLLLNLLTRPQFYKDYFDLIFFFSPSSKCDDLPKYLQLPDKRVFDKFDENSMIDILKTQEDIIKEQSIEKSPKILIILDDVQSEQRFLRSQTISTLFIRNRHLNISTWLCGQSYTRTPRNCRLQASGLFIFPGSQSEMDLLIDEYCPPRCNKKKFEEMLKYATKDKYNFMFINNQADFENRYRKNMDMIIEY